MRHQQLHPEPRTTQKNPENPKILIQTNTKHQKKYKTPRKILKIPKSCKSRFRQPQNTGSTNYPEKSRNPEILRILIQTTTNHPEEAKEVGKEKTNDAEPCHAKYARLQWIPHRPPIFRFTKVTPFVYLQLSLVY